MNMRDDLDRHLSVDYQREGFTLPECRDCFGVGERPVDDLPRVGGFPHPDQEFETCLTCNGRGTA